MKPSYWTIVYNVWLLAVSPCLCAYFAPTLHRTIRVVKKKVPIENEDTENKPLNIVDLENELNDPTSRKNDQVDDMRHLIPEFVLRKENQTIEVDSTARKDDIEATEQEETTPELEQNENAPDKRRMLIARVRTNMGQTQSTDSSSKQTLLRIGSDSKLNHDSNYDYDTMRRVINRVSPGEYKYKYSDNAEGVIKSLIDPTLIEQIKWGVKGPSLETGFDPRLKGIISKRLHELWPHQEDNSHYDYDRQNQINIMNKGKDISEFYGGVDMDHFPLQLGTNPTQHEGSFTIQSKDTPDTKDKFKKITMLMHDILGIPPATSKPPEISEISNNRPSLEVLPILSPENQFNKNPNQQIQIDYPVLPNHIPFVDLTRTEMETGTPENEFIDSSLKPSPFSPFAIQLQPKYSVPEKYPYFYYPQKHPTKPKLQIDPERDPLKDLLFEKMCQASYKNFLTNWRIILDYFGLNKRRLDDAESRELSLIFETFLKMNEKEDINKMPINSILYKLIGEINKRDPITGQTEHIHETPNENHFNYPRPSERTRLPHPLKHLKSPTSDTDLNFIQPLLSPISPESEFYWKRPTKYSPKPVYFPDEMGTENPLNFLSNEEPTANVKTPHDIVNDGILSFEQPGGGQTTKEKFSVIIAKIIDYLTKHHHMPRNEIKPLIVNAIMSALTKPKHDCEKKKYLMLIEHLKGVTDYYLSQADCDGVYRSGADKPQLSKTKSQQSLRNPVLINVMNEVIQHKEMNSQN